MDIDYAGLVSAIIGLITAVSAAIKLHNAHKQRKLDSENASEE